MSVAKQEIFILTMVISVKTINMDFYIGFTYPVLYFTPSSDVDVSEIVRLRLRVMPWDGREPGEGVKSLSPLSAASSLQTIYSSVTTSH